MHARVLHLLNLRKPADIEMAVDMLAARYSDHTITVSFSPTITQLTREGFILYENILHTRYAACTILQCVGQVLALRGQLKSGNAKEFVASFIKHL